MSKLIPIDVADAGNNAERFDLCYRKFCEDSSQSDDRVMLKGDIVLFNFHDAEFKTESFWHASSFGRNEIPKSDSLPCVDGYESLFCDNCITKTDWVTMERGEERLKCLFRARRVNFIRACIELHDTDDERIQYFERENKEKKLRIYIRYIEDELDYIVVLRRTNRGSYFFVTAFPVCYQGSKDEFSRYYLEYKKGR